MKQMLLSVGLVIVLSACAATETREIEPIPGSITYGGQPRTKLTKSPIGSTFHHEFVGSDGTRWIETYRIRPDRSVEIISRRRFVEFEISGSSR
jgi:hypothetical protein